MAKVITNIEELSRGTLSTIHNWVVGRIDLHTKYEKGQGKQRRYYYDNALELAFMVALTKAGLRASAAIGYSDRFRDLNRQDELRAFFGFADGNPNVGKMDDADSLEQWQHWFPEAVVICLIPVKEIRDRVDTYFKTHGVEAE